jgi:hypothetical protein
MFFDSVSKMLINSFILPQMNLDAMLTTEGCDIFSCSGISITDTSFYPCMRHCYLVVDNIKGIESCEEECHKHGSSTVCFFNYIMQFFSKNGDWGVHYSPM